MHGVELFQTKEKIMNYTKAKLFLFKQNNFTAMTFIQSTHWGIHFCD